MSMSISPLQSQALAQLAAQRLQKSLASQATAPTPESFSDAFKTALTSVSQAQNQASKMQNDVQMGNPAASLEQTMMAMQKAQIGFQATLNVRNRMVQAYSDIMNMQV